MQRAREALLLVEDTTASTTGVPESSVLPSSEKKLSNSSGCGLKNTHFILCKYHHLSYLPLKYTDILKPKFNKAMLIFTMWDQL